MLSAVPFRYTSPSPGSWGSSLSVRVHRVTGSTRVGGSVRTVSRSLHLRQWNLQVGDGGGLTSTYSGVCSGRLPGRSTRGHLGILVLFKFFTDNKIRDSSPRQTIRPCLVCCTHMGFQSLRSTDVVGVPLLAFLKDNSELRRGPCTSFYRPKEYLFTFIHQKGEDTGLIRFVTGEYPGPRTIGI